MNIVNKNMDKEQIIRMLKARGREQEMLFEEARKTRYSHSKDKIFLYGFVYFSTFCRNDCEFCYYRKSNDINRYRKSPFEIKEISVALARSGVNLIDFTMGEDPSFRDNNFGKIIDLIKTIKKETGLSVMISPGILSNIEIDMLDEAGVDWYALYQETHNQELFARLRRNQDYNQRMNAKLYAKEKGLMIEEGILVGAGENYGDIAESIIRMGEIGAKQVRVMSLVPQKGSPMEYFVSPDRNIELNTIAIMRILYENVLIPASLDVDGIEGLEERLNAGANVITSIIPPRSGLLGVAHSSMDVDSGGRTVEEVSKILFKIGLSPAKPGEYVKYLGYLK